LPYSDGDKIYGSVGSGSPASGYVGRYAELTIKRTSLTTGVTTTVFAKYQDGSATTVDNFSNPVTVSSGYTYEIICIVYSQLLAGVGNGRSEFISPRIF
jgi:hypothetical protein